MEKEREGDVWFRYESACESLMQVGTCSIADFDTLVDVFQGECGALAPVACVDEDSFCTVSTGTAYFQAQCGVTYFIRVSGVAGSGGNGLLEIQCLGLPCESCSGDLDGDGVVGGADFGLLLSAWGSCGKDGCPADLDGDGVVSGTDIGLLLVDWGDC